MKVAVVIAIAVVATAASADPLRLRADALASTASPAGLLVLEADGALRSGMSAEAVVWVAGAQTPGEDISGDVLVIAVDANGTPLSVRMAHGSPYSRKRRSKMGRTPVPFVESRPWQASK